MCAVDADGTSDDYAEDALFDEVIKPKLAEIKT